MIRRSDIRRLASWLLIAVVVAGCQTPPSAPPAAPSASSARRPGRQLDDCADRLQDLCGQLLLYYSVKRHNPERLSELGGTGAGAVAPPVCPVSGKPYVYEPEGLAIPGSTRRILVYDAEPCHSAKRWAIVAEASKPGQPLVARVILLPDASPFPRPEK